MLSGTYKNIHSASLGTEVAWYGPSEVDTMVNTVFVTGATGYIPRAGQQQCLISAGNGLGKGVVANRVEIPTGQLIQGKTDEKFF
jgi:hypothetical protein